MAEVFPGASAEVVADDGVDLVVALWYARERRGRGPTLRQRVDLLRGSALRLFDTEAPIPLSVTVLVARDPEEVAAVSAAWQLGEEARSRALRERGHWDHPGGRGAAEPFLSRARAEGRLVEFEGAATQRSLVKRTSPPERDRRG